MFSRDLFQSACGGTGVEEVEDECCKVGVGALGACLECFCVDDFFVVTETSMMVLGVIFCEVSPSLGISFRGAVLGVRGGSCECFLVSAMV